MNAWVSGARPRTLGAGIVPVLVGTAAADRFIAWRFGAALLVAIGLQVGVNYANDYFDGIRGVDTPERVGPPRLVATGVASPPAVLVAALASIGVAGFAGLALAFATEPVLILFVGALALVATFAYSGGPKPYAGLGLGEVMVFVFFGLMATCGSAFVMTETVPAAAWWCGAPLGSWPWRSWSPTTSGTSRRMLGRGSARRRSDWATDARGRSTALASWPPSRRSSSAGRPFIVDQRIGLTQWGLLGLAGWIPAIRPMERVGAATGPELVPRSERDRDRACGDRSPVGASVCSWRGRSERGPRGKEGV